MNTEQEPGTWSEDPEINDDPFHQPAGPAQPPKSPVYSEVNRCTPEGHLGRSVSLATQKFGMPKRVVYPACGAHVIDDIFPGAEIVYIDPSETGIAQIVAATGRKANALALHIEQYKGQAEFDWLFSMNSHAPMSDQLSLLKNGGIVFCNNYFGTKDAEDVMKSGTCTLIAVIEFNEDEASLKEPDSDKDMNQKGLYYVFRKNERKSDR